ncbi:hypothetical protein [Novosphingobium sp. HII-3]|uniref:hypothetical protein n=1 Tax=Novosphingobium sp. HII-3 TaxID=2075565 RepID=UPI000CDAC964|nr:hypothetical protein [Novosphingobium sp. HII-3]
MTDIALADAQIIWDRGGAGNPPVKVVGGGVKDDQRYSGSWGSCNQDFNEADDDGKLRMLLTQSIYLTLVESIDPTIVHDAFMVIPEYRVALRRLGVIPLDEETEC